MTGADLVKLVMAVFLSVGVPALGLIVYFARRQDIVKHALTEKDITGFGTRMSRFEENLTRVSEQITASSDQYATAQSDTMAAIRAIGEANVTAIHKIDKEVAVLKERNDVAECINQFTKVLEAFARDRKPQ